MVDVSIEKAVNIEPIRISEVKQIDPITIADVEKIAPAAVHIKELNNIDPLLIESLLINRVHNIDPVQIEKFNITHVPTVNLSLSRAPVVDLNVKRVPPVAIAVQQCFDLASRYTIHARLLGFEVARLEMHGETKVIPRDRYRREQAHVHERSFADVAPAGNPGIPVRVSETCSFAQVTPACPPRAAVPKASHPGSAAPAVAPAQRARARPQVGPQLRVGSPQAGYSIRAADVPGASGSSVGSGD